MVFREQAIQAVGLKKTHQLNSMLTSVRWRRERGSSASPAGCFRTCSWNELQGLSAPLPGDTFKHVSSFSRSSDHNSPTERGRLPNGV